MTYSLLVKKWGGGGGEDISNSVTCQLRLLLTGVFLFPVLITSGSLGRTAGHLLFLEVIQNGFCLMLFSSRVLLQRGAELKPSLCCGRVSSIAL